jgi:hypothetical protein
MKDEGEEGAGERESGRIRPSPFLLHPSSFILFFHSATVAQTVSLRGYINRQLEKAAQTDSLR